MNKPVIAPPASAGAVVRLDDTDRAPDEARRRYEHSWVDSTRSLDGGRYIRG